MGHSQLFRRVGGLAGGVVLALSAFTVPATAASLGATVSDVGTAPAAVSASHTSSFEGTGDLRDARGVQPVPAGHRFDGLPGIGIQSIIGPDDRVRVNPTTSFPARAAVLITRTPPGGTERQHCTGWMYGPSLVLTAGHCVYSGGFHTGQLRFYPGYNGNTAPYGGCGATQLLSNPGWTNNGSPDYDYGGAKLDCTIGNTVGWYGAYHTTASLVGTATTIQGYPGDKAKQQWLSTDRIRTSGALRLYYQNDTVGGNSGSGVHTVRAAGSAVCAEVCSLAFHAYGGSQNSGARITLDRFNQINGWRG